MISSAIEDCPTGGSARQLAIVSGHTRSQTCAPPPKQRSPGSLRGLASMIPVIRGSIAIVIRLVRTFLLYADVVGLVLAQLGELDADLGQMQPGHLLVQRLRQHVDFLLVLAILVVGEEFDLRQRL